MSSLVVGVDPGLSTGIFAIAYDEARRAVSGPIAVQVHGSEGVVPLVEALIGKHYGYDVVLAVEQFVVGPRASRSSSAQAGRITRALIQELAEIREDVFTRSAALVKPWATDRRLEAAGILAATNGMQHARDASRHALYAAVHQGLADDPLSTKAAAR